MMRRGSKHGPRGAALMLALACAALLSGCKPKLCPNQPERRSAAVFVLYDLSGTAKESRANYFNYTKELLSELRPGDVFVADAISSDSLSTRDYAVNKVFEEYPVYDSAKTTSRKFRIECDKVAKKFEGDSGAAEEDVENFLVAAPPAAQTQILSGLYNASRVFESYPTHERILVVFSDGVEDSELAKFDKVLPTDASAAALLQKLRDLKMMPNLSGVRVIFIGAAPNSVRIVKGPNEDYIAVKTFWLRYFKEVGALLEDRNYGTKPVKIDLAN